MDATSSGRKEEFANSKYKSPACQSIYAGSVIIEPAVFVIIQEHARQVSSDQFLWASPFFAPFAMQICNREGPQANIQMTHVKIAQPLSTITINLDL